MNEIYKVGVASQKGHKLLGIHQGLYECGWEELETTGLLVPSGVAEQPLDEEETRRGSERRVKSAATVVHGKDIYAASEGGIIKMNGKYYSVEAVSLQMNGSDEVKTGFVRSVTVPDAVMERVLSGERLSLAISNYKGMDEHTVQSIGVEGVFSDKEITRVDVIREATVMAWLEQ